MNPVLAQIAPSLIRELNAKKRPDSLDFGLGEPTLRPDPALFEAATRWVAENGCPYTPNAGFGWLREAIAQHYAYPNYDQASNVCITNGSQEALYLAIKALLDPAEDEVLVVEPGYPLYPKLCQMEGIASRTVTLDSETGFAPSAETVLAALGPKTRMIVLSSPCNPTGRIWPEHELRALAQGLSNRPGAPVWVLSDEVYRELYYTPEPPASIAQFYPYALVANSLSKSNALTGLRLGWLLAPSAVMPAIIKVHQFVTTAASTFSQVVAGEVFRTPGGLGVHRAHYAALRESLIRHLTESGLDFVAPEGAFYCLIRLPEPYAADSIQTAYTLLDRANVVLTPGKAFGAEGWLRLSWVSPPEVLAEGIARLSRTLQA
ncbi:pyridoxal phosphate-dependent aminotransferase [bacterium]|nr:pyridoxal phosphate-dependent aminotransferase [bacterium]